MFTYIQKSKYLFCFCVCIFLLFSCKKNKFKNYPIKKALGTQGMIKYPESTKEDIIIRTIDEIKNFESKLSRYNKNSDISRFNKSSHGIKVEPAVYEILFLSKKLYRDFPVFDITLLPVIKLWDYKKKKIPTPRQIKEAMNNSGMAHLKLMGDNQVIKDIPLQVDLGGIAKGYIIDKAVAYLKANKTKIGIVEIGGDLFAFGKQWSVGIMNPITKKPGFVLIVEDKAVVTSGDYHRFFERNGVRYSHIIDPRVAAPVKVKANSVTVIGPNTAVADAMATAFFILGPEESFKVLKKYPNYEAFFILDDLKLVKSKNFKHRLERLNKLKVKKNPNSKIQLENESEYQ